jgi:hypothetical protein
MPTELDELKLRVSLEDDASSQIAALRGNVERLGQVSQSRLTEHVGAFEKAIGSLSQRALGVGHSFENLSRVFGVMPVGLGLIGYEAGRAREKMEQFTTGMVAMTNAARMSGVNIADFQAVLEAFERAGIPREQAAAQIASFTAAVTKLSIPGSKERQELLNMAGRWAPEMAQFIQRIVDTKDPVDRLNIAIQGLREVRDYELTQTHDEQLAIGKAEAVAAMLGLDTSTLNLREKLERDDVRHAERVQNQSEAQVKYNTALVEQQQVEGRIHDIINSSTMVWETWATKEITWIERFILQRLELYNAFSAGAPAVHTYSTQDIGRAIGTEQAPGFLSERFKTMFGGGGEEPAAAAPAAGEGGEKKSEATQENTKEIKTLTENIGKLIQRGFGGIFNMPIQAMAKGGLVAKPTLALVGERGKEAIVNKHGSRIVDKPTVGMLGTNYPEAVLPLGTDPTLHGQVSGKTLGVGESETGRASFYGNYPGQYDWRDPQDVYTKGPMKGQPMPGYTGTPLNVPGIALPSAVTSGRSDKQEGAYFAVTSPTGQTVYAPQVDIGPGKRTGRMVDINAPLAELMGYTPDEYKGPNRRPFPTDTQFTVRRVDPEEALWQGHPFQVADAGQPIVPGAGLPQDRAAVDRMAFDQLLAGDIHKVSADGEMEVNHDNAPDGVSVKAEGPLFKRVAHNRRSAPGSLSAFQEKYGKNIYPSSDDGPGIGRRIFTPVAAAVRGARGETEDLQPEYTTGGIRG